MPSNKVQLITYVDRLGKGGIEQLDNLLANQLDGLFGGIHLLPFYDAIDGEDAGFDPKDHTRVDPRMGDWQDIKAIGQRYDIMADMIVNHMSADSPQFQDVLSRGTESCYWPLFLTKDKVFEQAQETDLAKIYRPRPTPCFTNITLNDGLTYPFWTTFTEKQIDIDVNSDSGKHYLGVILDTFSANQVDLIRLDAAGYAIKKAGTSCFMIEETFQFIEHLSARAAAQNMTCLVEIHSHYQTQIDIAKRCELVYDFALPPLVLHTLFTANSDALICWLSQSPRNCITVLDTHDGIGIVDVGPEGEKAGLLDPTQIDTLVETIHRNSKDQSRKATGAAASNVDLYQVNCTYYDALAQNDSAYLMARAIQFFSPGIPQVYYAGLLAVPNDMELLASTNVGRDINRPYLSERDVEQCLQKPVVKALCELIKIRNSSDAFNGEFEVNGAGHSLTMLWRTDVEEISLNIDLQEMNAQITLTENGDVRHISLQELLEVS